MYRRRYYRPNKRFRYAKYYNIILTITDNKEVQELISKISNELYNIAKNNNYDQYSTGIMLNVVKSLIKRKVYELGRTGSREASKAN